jgi:hypothetical protein
VTTDTLQHWNDQVDLGAVPDEPQSPRGVSMYPPVSHTTDLVAALFDEEPCRAAARAEPEPAPRRRTIRQRLRRG